MSLDGIVVKSIVEEFKERLLSGKIDKVYQPEKDEILLYIRNKGQNYKVVMSSSSSNPRAHITKYSKKNPANPPMYCMLLRKHLQGGKITGVYQSSLDRILAIDIENLDELGVLSTKQLIIEIMGRHSNIILVEKNTGKIIDSIKRVSADMSSVRQVLPGLVYEYPPNQNKLNPLDINCKEFLDCLLENNLGKLVYKHIYNTYIGVSPLIAREICYRGSIDASTQIQALNHNEKESLSSAFEQTFTMIRENKFTPTIVKSINESEVIAFSVLDLVQYNDFPKIHSHSVSAILEEFFISRDNIDRIKQKSANLRKTISVKLERALNKLSKQQEELLDAQKRDIFRIYGDLITANMYKIDKGIDSVKLNNFYDEKNNIIEIKLDPQLNPSQNAQRYFKKYNKLKNAFDLVSEQIVKTKEEVDYLENVLMAMDNCTELSELEEIKDELVKEGYIKNTSKNKQKKKEDSVSKPRHYISTDGFDIYVGKNNKQNDYLTLKLATKDDLWFHTKDIPGSHVILNSNGKDIPASTINEAAKLAAFFSKGKMSSNVPIDYTIRKNVKKPNGSKPGMVIYENYNTIYVTPDEEEINKMKQVD